MKQDLVYREGVFNILINAKFKEMEFEDLDIWKLTDEILDYLLVKRSTPPISDSHMTPLEWFTTPNPLLGNVSPIEMIKNGRGDKLCKWIANQIDENTMTSTPKCECNHPCDKDCNCSCHEPLKGGLYEYGCTVGSPKKEPMKEQEPCKHCGVIGAHEQGCIELVTIDKYKEPAEVERLAKELFKVVYSHAIFVTWKEIPAEKMNCDRWMRKKSMNYC